MRRILPIVTASAALLAVGCASRPASYVGSDRTAVRLITWSAEQGGRARGTITDGTLSGAAPSQIVTVQTVPVTVRFNGRDVSIHGRGIGALGGSTITGTLSGGRLTITAPRASEYPGPTVLWPADLAVYRADAAKLRQRVSYANKAARLALIRHQHAAQVTTDQQQVGNDVSTLQSDVGTLGSDMAQMSTDVQQVSTDLAQLQSDASNGPGPSCANVSTVDGDATTVDNDVSTVGNDETTVEGDIGTVQAAIIQLTGDVATLLKAGGSAVGDPSPPAVISQAQTDVTNAVTQANSYIATVNGYLQQAYTTAQNLAGSNCGSAG